MFVSLSVNQAGDYGIIDCYLLWAYCHTYKTAFLPTLYHAVANGTTLISSFTAYA